MSDALNKELNGDQSIIQQIIKDEVVHFPEFSDNPVPHLSPKDILVMVDYEGGEFPKEESELLGNIYNALKLDRAQTNFIDLGKHQVDYKVLESLEAKNLIFFGIHPETLRLNLEVQPYYLHQFKGQQLLFSFPLSDLIKNPGLKKNLWEAFKKMFNIQ